MSNGSLKGNPGGLTIGDPWENLANAIIAQAAHDYEMSFTPRGKKIDRDEVVRFFRSGWYEMLTSVDPEFVIHGLNERVSGE